MEIKEETKKKTFRCYDEAMGVAINKKSVLKKKKPNVLSYSGTFAFLSISYLLLSIFLSHFKGYFCEMGSQLLNFAAILFLCMIIIRVILYFSRKKCEVITTIDKEGITDTSFYGMKLLINWEKIEAIVIKKYSITILTNTPILLYFDKSLEEKIIKGIKKYKKDILIIQ